MSFTDNLYTITNKTAKSVEISLANKEHPVFSAHFPSFSILPGFLQIDIAQELFNINIKKIKRTKFLTIVKPNNKIIFTKTGNKIILNNAKNTKISEIIYE